MLTASIDLFEGLLVQKSSQAVLIEYLLQNLHNDHVLVDGQACVITDRSYLELVECHLIVLGFEGNAKL
jgi:hypothetical protein